MGSHRHRGHLSTHRSRHSSDRSSSRANRTSLSSGSSNAQGFVDSRDARVPSSRAMVAQGSAAGEPTRVAPNITGSIGEASSPTLFAETEEHRGGPSYHHRPIPFHRNQLPPTAENDLGYPIDAADRTGLATTGNQIGDVLARFPYAGEVVGADQANDTPMPNAPSTTTSMYVEDGSQLGSSAGPLPLSRLTAKSRRAAKESKRLTTAAYARDSFRDHCPRLYDANVGESARPVAGLLPALALVNSFDQGAGQPDGSTAWSGYLPEIVETTEELMGLNNGEGYQHPLA